MLKSVRPRVGFILLAIVVLSLVAVLPASASGSAGAGCPPVYHRVARGEYLSRIAARYGVTVWQLQQWNGIRNINRIYEGQVLVIYPAWCARPAPRPAPKPVPAPWPAPKPAPCSAPCPAPAPCCAPAPRPGPRCPDQRAVITSPAPNAHVSGWVTIRGSATHENFAFYKLEYGAGSNPNTWSWFFGDDHPVWHGTLGALNVDTLPPGTYTIRLTVVDKTSNYPPPCQVTIVVR